MGRKRKYIKLKILMNNRLVGFLTKESSGSISFVYDSDWLAWEYAVPVSLSLPLRDDPYRGTSVTAVFDNLLPDSEALRKRIAERLGAEGIDAFSLLSSIGRDCVGALQFIPENENIEATSEITGTTLTESEIETILQNLRLAPLGLDKDSDFRISIAGVQEKTALLYKDGQWFKPTLTTPTTHIFKIQIGHLPNGIDLSNSVENEFYCLKVLEAFGLPVNRTVIQTFGTTKALVIERFDRLWTKDGRLLRLPQEDFCQALSVLPTLKYQDHGGPGIVDIMKLLKGSDEPLKDQIAFFKCQILFWLTSAIDGHAKNFSVFIYPGGRYKLAPFYDVLTAQPSISAQHIDLKKIKLAMSIGSSRHYKINEIAGRHFIQTGANAGLSKPVIQGIFDEIVDSVPQAFARIENLLPSNFPEYIHDSVKAAVTKRIELLKDESPKI